MSVRMLPKTVDVRVREPRRKALLQKRVALSSRLEAERSSLAHAHLTLLEWVCHLLMSPVVIKLHILQFLKRGLPR